MKAITVSSRWDKHYALYVGEGVLAQVIAKAVAEGASLAGANLDGASLAGANLDGASLAGANLEGARLVGANLDGANLERADLACANLERANLKGANLKGARLVGATLAGANLDGANLERANLDGADLRSANLDGADLERATINWQSHELISRVLMQAAGESVPRRMVAGLVLISRDICWDQFLALDIPERDWALDTLATFGKGDERLPIQLEARG